MNAQWLLVHTCAMQSRARNSKNQYVNEGRNKWHRWSLVSTSLSIFQIMLPETSCHAKTRQRLWQLARTYLLIINVHIHQKVYYLSYLILYLKKMTTQAYQHIHSTILTHNTRAQEPKLGRTSRDVSDTRAWHTTFIHSKFTYLNFLKSTNDG